MFLVLLYLKRERNYDGEMMCKLVELITYKGVDLLGLYRAADVEREANLYVITRALKFFNHFECKIAFVFGDCFT